MYRSFVKCLRLIQWFIHPKEWDFLLGFWIMQLLFGAVFSFVVLQRLCGWKHLITAAHVISAYLLFQLRLWKEYKLARFKIGISLFHVFNSVIDAASSCPHFLHWLSCCFLSLIFYYLVSYLCHRHLCHGHVYAVLVFWWHNCKLQQCQFLWSHNKLLFLNDQA